MQIKLRKFMATVASREQIQEVLVEGVFKNSATNTQVLNLPGAVYGFCVQLSDKERDAVFAEAEQKKTNHLDSVNDWYPLQDNIYPLYWGKDRMLGTRLPQHLKNSNAAGLVRLNAYKSLYDKEIAFAIMTVTQDLELETALQVVRPHLFLAVTRVI